MIPRPDWQTGSVGLPQNLPSPAKTTTTTTTLPAEAPNRRRRVATFSFKGVVAARNRDAARSMRNCVEHMCQVIIDTYRVCMDTSKTTEEKSAKLADIQDVDSDLRFILGFVREESNACKVERVKVQMTHLASKMEPNIYRLLDELKMVRRDPHMYQRVFDGLLSILDDNTQFLKLGHSVEQARVLDIAFNAVSLVRQVRDANDEDALINAAQLASGSCMDLLGATRRLLSVQEKQNAHLMTRIDAAQTILKEALPNFLRRSEDKVNMPTDANIERQQHACQELTAVLEEVIQVVKEVRGDYDSSFMDQVVNDSALTESQKKLNGAMRNVTSMLAKLHATAEEAEKANLKDRVAEEARAVASALQETGGEEDDTIEFVQAVKQGVQDSNKDFFTAQKRINALATKAIKPTVQSGSGFGTDDDGGSKDMLEAAKDMLSALKGVSSALSDAPELRGLV